MAVTFKVEIDFDNDPKSDAETWVDLSEDVRSVSTRRGRQGALSRDESGSCSIVLKNQSGNYDFRNTDGPHYPMKLGRKVRIGGQLGSELAYLNMPENPRSCGTWHYGLLEYQGIADLPVGDLDVRASVAPTSWANGSQCVFNIGGDSDYGLILTINEDGTLGLGWTDVLNGFTSAVSTASVPFSAGSRGAIRATLDADTSASHRVMFYTSDDDGDTWDALGSPVDGGFVTVLAYNNETMSVGGVDDFGSFPSGDVNLGIDNQFLGKMFWITIKDGIDGTDVVSPDFEQTAIQGSTSIIRDAQGNIFFCKFNAMLRHDTSAKAAVFHGISTEYEVGQTARRKGSYCSISAVDLFAVLAECKLTSGVVGQSEAIIEELGHYRIDKMLTVAGIRQQDRKLDPSFIMMAEVKLDDVSVLEHIQHVTDTEIGRFFISTSGHFVFMNRDHTLYGRSGAVQCTFGDAIAIAKGHDVDVEILEPPKWTLSDRGVYNSVRVSRVNGGDPIIVDNETSIDAYYERGLPRENMLYVNDDETETLATYLLDAYSEPRVYITPIKVLVSKDPDRLWPIVSRLELSDLVQVITYYDQGSSPQIEQYSIDSIDMDADQNRLEFTFKISPVLSPVVARYGAAVYGTDTYTF